MAGMMKYIKFETELSDDVHILTNRLYLMRTIRELLYKVTRGQAPCDTDGKLTEN